MTSARTLFVALVVALGCAPTPPPSPTRPPATTAGAEVSSEIPASFRRLRDDEQRFVAQLVEVTSRVRGLPLQRPLTTRVGSHRDIAAHLVSGIEDEDIVELRDLYVTLGMLEADVDIVHLLADVVGEQVIGFYDPKRDFLVIRDDVMASFVSGRAPDPEAVLTVAHEIVHALQAQHLGLREHMDAETTMDVGNAFTSVAEGDATLAMLLVGATLAHAQEHAVLDALPRTVREGLAASAGPGNERLEAAPAIVRVGLTVPYVAGLLFCSHLYRRYGLAAIDAAHREPPTTSEQVLHVEKYEQREPALPVPIGALPALDAAGYRTVREDSLGELEVGIYLALGTGEDIAFDAAAGWGGDAVRIVEHEGQRAAVFFIAFDSTADAEEAMRALEAQPATAARDRWTRRDDRVVGIAHGLPAPLAATLTTRLGELAEGLRRADP